jgi:magnesium-transporting ATPase (P-type)
VVWRKLELQQYPIHHSTRPQLTISSYLISHLISFHLISSQLKAYGIVRATGVHTEIGSTNADIMADKTEIKVSVFEARVLMTVKIIILISLIDVFVIFLVQGITQDGFTKGGYKDLLLTCLSIIIAAIPVALPIVLQVRRLLLQSTLSSLSFLLLLHLFGV